MSIAKISPLTGDVARYRPETGWPPLQACVMAAFILAVSAVSGRSAFSIVADWSSTAPGTAEEPFHQQLLVAQLLMQLAAIALVWWAAEFHRSDRWKALALRPVPGFWAIVGRSSVLILLVSGGFSALAWLLRPQDILTDLSDLWPIMKGENWWLLLFVAVIGAPLSEELLFRGFLQSALAQSRLGFWGAVLITNTAWAALHAGYTVTGLVDVFIAGLLFSWVLWRSGSLWVPIVCHGLYNGLIFAVLWLLPLPEGLPTVPS